ncbi:unnamed protein product [Schistocephalus solidus]|uniref:Secreted protein n=1 Tax=Schistocephalus solidus TaxID=70667 RepID=A0A183S852_SCHSO|nr:unnamed protein product [Schistocephalus solidus]
MLLWASLTGTQLSPVAPRSWVLPSGHTPGNRHDRTTKPGEGRRCCVCRHTRYVCSIPPVLALSRPPCPSSSPFPTPLPSPLLLLLHPLLSPPLLILASTPPLLPLSSPFPPSPRLKCPTARATCNHVGSPGESVVLSLTQIVTHSGVR